MTVPRKPYSPARRIARAVVWITFAVVLYLRFFVVRVEHGPSSPNNRPFWAQMDGRQGRPGGPMGRRFRRPPTPLFPPVAVVPNDLPRLRIQIAPGDVEKLRGYYWNGWQGARQERPEVLATVREGDIVYTNVSLHLKGAAGSFRPFDDKPALTLNFSKHAPGQHFHEYTKLSLNNSVQDPTYLCEALCRELYNAAGVPAPRAEWATVLINDRDLGLYVLVEGWGKEFLRRHFKNVKGNLYDGGFVRDINPRMAVNSGDHPEDTSDISRLMAAASEPAAASRWKRLNEVLDVDRFITLAAMEIMLCHWDGYMMNRNNFRLFHDLDTDRMIFMPHGLDQMFDFPPGRFPVEGTIQPIMNSMVARAVLTVPEAARRYRLRLESLRTNLFQEEFVLGRVREMAERIRPTLAAYSPSLAQRHESDVAFLCDRISRRIRHVTEELNRPRDFPRFDASGAAYLTNWTGRVLERNSFLKIDMVQENGKTFLHARASDQPAPGTATWRLRLPLEPGLYRLEARARASAEAVGGKVCLRSSTMRPFFRKIEDTHWMDLSLPFAVEQIEGEIALACEFTTKAGEVWFDADSLRLVRVQE
jgi:spore coat protein H